MAKFHCKQCGVLVETMPGDKRTVFCSEECHSKFRFQREPFTCPHNEGVECTLKRCGGCGWNPVVAERRIKKLYDSRCVCCGEYVPEGRQICPDCERVTEDGN